MAYQSDGYKQGHLDGANELHLLYDVSGGSRGWGARGWNLPPP